MAVDTTIIVRNVTTSNILIDDLGIRIPGSSQVTLVEPIDSLFDEYEIEASEDLKYWVRRGDIVVSKRVVEKAL